MNSNQFKGLIFDFDVTVQTFWLTQAKKQKRRFIKTESARLIISLVDSILLGSVLCYEIELMFFTFQAKKSDTIIITIRVRTNYKIFSKEGTQMS